MSVMLLLLNVCVITVIHLTSSQSTYDVIQQDSDVSSCAGNEQVLKQLVTAVSQLHTAISQLQRDVAELKAAGQQQDVKDVKASCTECSTNFTRIAASVNGCYKVVTRVMNWDQAGLHCQSLNKDAHLLIVNDSVEQAAIATMLASNNDQCSGYWTAGQRVDPNSQSTFVWRVKSTVSIMTYTNWGYGEPTYGRNAEACMIIYQRESHKWHDVSCSVTDSWCPICELDA